MTGGIGAKKVDVTWATEEGGLLLGISIKGINFRDGRSKNFRKNLTNRRGDMLFEAVTLHRRFPYAVLGGLFFLDHEAKYDATARRRSTFVNAHARFSCSPVGKTPEDAMNSTNGSISCSSTRRRPAHISTPTLWADRTLSSRCP